MSPIKETTRRKFLKNTGIAASTVFAVPAIVSGQNLNSKIRVACIGVGGKGDSDTKNAAKEGGEIVALCDVDTNTLDRMHKNFPKSAKFQDFREMFDKMEKDIDAVTVSTPDHMHGCAGILAMQLGKHAYVQKPLTQTVWEARTMRDLARENKLATQMGNQGSADDGLRRGVELVHGGIIGKPKELHVWSNRPIWPQGFERPEGEDPIPENLDWDLWLGCAQPRPFKKGIYHSFKWRGWKDFGTGALGDMACHTVNMPFRALKLGYPERIECEFSSREYSETYPKSSRVRFDFPARDGWPPLKFYWYEGKPDANFFPIRPYPDLIRNVIAAQGKFPGSGALIIGDEGEMYSGNDYGSSFSIKRNDDEKYVGGDQHEMAKTIEKTIPRSPGHVREWFDMMKGGAPAYSNFEIAGYLTEVILLGCIAQNIGEGRPIKWDGPNMKSLDNEEASKLVKREYRDGWAPKV